MEHSRDEYLFVYVGPHPPQWQCLVATQAMLMAGRLQVLGLRTRSLNLQQAHLLFTSASKFRVFLFMHMGYAHRVCAHSISQVP